MGEQQVFAVVNWWYDPQEKVIKVNVPRVCSSKKDAILYVNLNKVNDGKKWEVHTTIAELAGAFNFSTDITPNYK